MNIKQYFNKLSVSTKGKIGILGLLFFFSLVDWVIHPPFFKDQEIKIVNIEHWKQTSTFHPKPKYYYKVYYIYNTANGETIEGNFEPHKFPMPKLNDTIVRNVRTPYSDGGELRLLSGGIILFLSVWSIFIIAFIFWQFLKGIGLKNIGESRAVDPIDWTA